MSEEVEEDNGGELDPRVFLLALAVVALPSVILASLLWALFQRWRIFQRFHQPVSNVAWLTLTPATLLGGWLVMRREAFTSIRGILAPDVLACGWGVLGLLGALALCSFGARKVQREPWLRKDGKHWASGYKPHEPFGVARRRKNLALKLERGLLYDDDKAPLGLAVEEAEVVSRYYEEANTHTLITGASGSGKSVTMRNLIYNDLCSGVPVFVVDFKRDLELAEKLASWCEDLGLSFKHFINTPRNEYRVKSNPAGPSYYDPLAGLSPDAKADMLLNMRKWDTAADVYRNNMQSVLTQLFGVLEEVRPFYGSKELEKYHLNDLGDLKAFETIIKAEDSLTDLLTVLPRTSLKYSDFENLARQVASRSKNDQQHAYNVLRTQLANITASDYGRWLAVDKRHEGLDLYELSNTPGAVLFSINADEAKAFAEAFGAVILQQMTNLSGYRQSQRVADKWLSIYVDEFAVLNPVTVKGLLERGRSSKVCVTLAIQSFQQVVTAAEQAGEALLQGYIDTVGNFVIHAGINFTTAEYMSNIFGKEWKVSYNLSHKSDASWFSLNRRAKQHQNIQQMEREEWVLDPTALTRVLGPVRSEGRAPEAFYITKNSSDPLHAGRRAVRLTATVPDFISDNDVDESFRMDVGPPAQEFIAEAKAGVDAVLIEAMREEMVAYGVGASFTPGESVSKADQEEADGGFVFLEEPEHDIELIAEELRALASEPSLSPEQMAYVRDMLAEHKGNPVIKAAVLEGKAIRDGRKAKQTSYNAFEEDRPLPGLPPREAAKPKPPAPAEGVKPSRQKFDQGF